MMDRRSILLIEDDVTVHEIVKMALDDINVNVMFAMNADAGYQVLEVHEPDLILLDLLLPSGKRGWDVINDIKSVPELAGIPIIVLTAAGSDAVKRALDAGASDYIMKPFTINELLRKINAHTAHQH